MNLAEAVYHEVLRYETELWADVDSRVRRAHGIELERFEVLRTIGDAAGSARVNDIAEHLAITVGATSKLVDRLERSGLCVRRANPADRRSSLISLTRSGEEMLDAAGETFRRALADSISTSLSEPDQHILVELLKRLRAGYRQPLPAGART